MCCISASSGGRNKKKEIPNPVPEVQTVDDPLQDHVRYERIADINRGTFGFVTKADDK